jgi:hypothetical protein
MNALREEQERSDRSIMILLTIVILVLGLLFAWSINSKNNEFKEVKKQYVKCFDYLKIESNKFISEITTDTIWGGLGTICTVYNLTSGQTDSTPFWGSTGRDLRYGNNCAVSFSLLAYYVNYGDTIEIIDKRVPKYLREKRWVVYDFCPSKSRVIDLAIPLNVKGGCWKNVEFVIHKNY